MARESANIDLEIWNDPDFQELTPRQQRLYMLLFSQKTINNAGVLPYMPSKWARGSKHTTADDVEADLTALEAARFVLTDRITEETLVRSFIRRDGVAKHKYLLRNALAMARRTESPALRSVLAIELRRLGNHEADAVANELEASSNRTPPEPHSNGIPTASEPGPNAQVVVEVVVPLGTNGERNVGTPVGRPRSQAKRGEGSRGTRIPDDFTVSTEMVAWARENTPDVDGRAATAEFIDYWRGRPGREGCKLDWPATWRNAMRREQKLINGRGACASPNGRMSPTDANIAAFASRHMSKPNLLALPGGAS